MISPEGHIVARLLASSAVSALVGDRIEPSASSEQTTLPRVVYTLISDNSEHHMLAASGLTFRRVQFDILAARKSEAEDIGEAFRNRLDGFRGTITTDGEPLRVHQIRKEGSRDESVPPFDGSDQIIYRRSLDYLISCAESIPTLT